MRVHHHQGARWTTCRQSRTANAPPLLRKQPRPRVGDPAITDQKVQILQSSPRLHVIGNLRPPAEDRPGVLIEIAVQRKPATRALVKVDHTPRRPSVGRRICAVASRCSAARMDRVRSRCARASRATIRRWTSMPGRAISSPVRTARGIMRMFVPRAKRSKWRYACGWLIAQATNSGKTTRRLGRRM